ncbi:MAG: entericidin A/B family lipoprotein [Bacteroides sp.]|nr:entericidin A/B family lipoprotein [Bacteroides sp.]
MSNKKTKKGTVTMLIKKRFLTLISLAVISLGLSACETMEGAGRDIEHAGESVQDAAE